MKRVLKWLFVAVAAGVVVVVVFAGLGIGALWFANRADDSLSALTTAVLQAESLPDPAQNGYFALVGLRSERAHEYGRRWYAAIAESKDTAALGAALKALPEAPLTAPKSLGCDPGKESCLARCKAKPDDARRLATEGRALALNYRQLRDYAAFVEAVPPNMRYDTPFPQFQPILDAQEVVQAEIALAATTGASDRALADLAAEIELHRRMLAGSRLLVLKMISRRALTRDIALLADFIVTQPQALRGTARPALERALRPLAPTELATDNVLQSELRIGVNFFLEAESHPELVAGSLEGDLPARILYPIAAIGFLPVTTANTYAALMHPYIAASREPTVRIEAAIADAKTRTNARVEDLAASLALRNIVGDKLVAIAVPDYADYILAVRDVDALVRLGAAVLDLATKGLTGGPNATAEKIRAALAAAGADRADPYSGQPFEYNEATASLAFEPRATSSRRIAVGPRRNAWTIALRAAPVAPPAAAK